jgi:hypothetical protein
MPTILDLIEGRELSFASQPASKPVSKSASPLTTHVSTHMQDPVGATKDQFGELQQAKLQYDMAREKTQRNLAPVQSVITHLSQMHGIDPNMPTPAMGMGSQPNSMGGPADPNDPNAQVDEDGNPIPPQGGGGPQLGPDIPPGGKAPQPPIGGRASAVPPPQNMNQSPGAMQQNRPSLVGHQPGVAPMSDKQVVPPKLGMAQPGKPNVPPNPQQNQFNKQAAPPKGNKSMPGAKGPGDPKVANRTKKAFGKSNGTKNEQDQRRPVKVTVHASASPLRITSVHDCRGLASLKFHASITAGAGSGGSAPIGPGGALGPSGVMPGSVPATGQPIHSSRRKVHALDELSQKEPGDTAHQSTYNPVESGQGAKGLEAKGRGNSHGAKKGWSTRGKGHLSKNEKAAHYGTLDLCAKCGGIHAKGTACKIDAGGPGSGRHKGAAWQKTQDAHNQRVQNVNDINRRMAERVKQESQRYSPDNYKEPDEDFRRR